MNHNSAGTPPEGENQNANAGAGTAPGATSNENDSHGLTGEDKLRAILRGEIPADDGAEDENAVARKAADDSEVIAEQFDPESGEFLETEPEPKSKPRAETAESEEDEEAGTEETNSEETETETEEAEAGEETDEEDDDENKQQEQPQDPKKRISIKRGRLNDRDFAVVQLADREKISLADAEKRLFGDAPRRVDESSTEQTTETEETPNSDVTPETIQTEIENLVAERAKAAKALDFEKSNELSDKIHDLKTQQRELRQDLANREQREAQKTADGVIASAEKALAMYPDAAVENSALFKAIDAERIAREKSDPGFFRNRNWPTVLAVEIASGLGIAPVVAKKEGAAAAAPAKPTAKPVVKAPVAKPVPQKSARPAPPNPAPGTTSTGGNATTEAALMEQLAKAKASRDPEKIKTVIRDLEKLEAAKRK